MFVCQPLIALWTSQEVSCKSYAFPYGKLFFMYGAWGARVTRFECPLRQDFFLRPKVAIMASRISHTLNLSSQFTFVIISHIHFHLPDLDRKRNHFLLTLFSRLKTIATTPNCVLKVNVIFSLFVYFIPSSFVLLISLTLPLPTFLTVDFQLKALNEDSITWWV